MGTTYAKQARSAEFSEGTDAAASSADAAGLRVMAVSDHLGHANGGVHGGTTYFQTTYPALVRAGVELKAVFLRGEHPAARELRENGVDPVFLDRKWWDPRALLDLRRLVREFKPDVLHLASFQSHALGRLLRKDAGPRVVIHLHDTLALSPANRIVQLGLASRTDAAIIISDDVMPTATRDYGLPETKVHKLHYGVNLDGRTSTDPAGDRARVRAEWGVGDDQPLVGVVARFHPMKGHRFAIDAMTHWRNVRPDARLVFVGDGDLRPDLERRIAEAGLSDAVTLAGQRPDVPAVMAALDVLAVSSTFGESFGLVAVEAMVNCRPVVTFACPGVPEVVVDGVGGLIVPNEGAAAMAEAWEKLFADRALYERLSVSAEARARSFTIPKHIDGLVSIYRKALA